MFIHRGLWKDSVVVLLSCVLFVFVCGDVGRLWVSFFILCLCLVFLRLAERLCCYFYLFFSSMRILFLDTHGKIMQVVFILCLCLSCVSFETRCKITQFVHLASVFAPFLRCGKIT